MASFSASESQNLTVTFQLNTTMSFPNRYEDLDAESFIQRLAETIIDNCDGEISDWEVFESDGEDDDGNLLSGYPYNMRISCFVHVTGSCYYDRGRYDGPMADCYPEEIDDIEYEDGMIFDCNTDAVLSIFPELLSLSVDIGEISEDGDIEIDEY